MSGGHTERGEETPGDLPLYLASHAGHGSHLHRHPLPLPGGGDSHSVLQSGALDHHHPHGHLQHHGPGGEGDGGPVLLLVPGESGARSPRQDLSRPSLAGGRSWVGPIPSHYINKLRRNLSNQETSD